MSRKELVLAATLLGAGANHCAYDENLFDDSLLEQDGELLAHVGTFAHVAMAMVEAAFNVTFTYPENYAMYIYRDCGYDFIDNSHWDGDADQFEHPSDEWMLDQLENGVNSYFKTVASPAQYESLRMAINRAREAYENP